MFKKLLFSTVIFILVAILAACSSLPIPGLSAASNPSSQTQNQTAQNQFSDPSKIPVQSKLGIGILKLEGTPNAITADQAKVMLPLWQAMKALTPNNNTSQDEITALDQQIMDALTPAQVTAIQNLTWTQADLRTLAQQYGVQFGGGNFGNLTADQRATRVAQFAAQNPGGVTRQGGGGGGGGFPGGGGGGFGGGGQTTGQRRTPVPGQTSNRGNRGGMNFLFADPVIKLLQTKAAS